MTHIENEVTFSGTGVKPRPRLSDITSAAALKEVTPSGTVIFPLVQTLPLIEKTGDKMCHRAYVATPVLNMATQ